MEKTLQVKDGKWHITITSDGGPDLAKVEPVIRSGFKAQEDRGRSRVCSVFTLMPNNSDACLVQLFLFADGDVRVQSAIPVLVRVINKKKKVYLDLFSVPGWVLEAAQSVL